MSTGAEIGASVDDPAVLHPCYDLRVSRVVHETADALSIVLDVPRELGHVFRYHAGQFVTLRISYAGKDLSRCYSLASSPDCETEHKVTVKRVTDGRVSNWLVDNIRSGDVLRVSPPGGRFTLTSTNAPLVLFAGGSGITPVISLLKTALVTSQRRCKLIYANYDHDSIIFRAELDRLAAAHLARFSLVHHLDVQRGFLDEAAVRAHVDTDSGAEFYICGPAAFMHTVERTLLALEVSPERVHVERFISPPDPDVAPIADVQTGADGATETAPAVISVYLDGRTRELEYEKGQTVLATVQRAGLEPPFSCTEGFCGCCMAKLRAGRVRMIRNDFLSPRELEEGWVLTCQSIPVSDECSVEYPD